MRFLTLLLFVPFLLACQAREHEEPAPVAEAQDVILSTSSSRIDDVLRSFDESVRSKQIEQKARLAQSDSEVTPEHMFYSSEITRLNNVVIDLQSENDVMQAELTFCLGNLSIHEQQVTKLVNKNKGGTDQELFLEKTKVRIYDLIVLYNTLLQYEQFITDPEMKAKLSAEMVRVKAELKNYGVNDNAIVITNFDLVELIKVKN